MKFLDALLARFGYVKLANYGLTMSPAGHVVPMPGTAVPPGWQSRDGQSLPLMAAPELIARHALPAAPPRPAAPTAAPFSLWSAPAPPEAADEPAEPTGADAEMPTTERQPTTDADVGDPGDDEWEWRVAAARAKARNDDTAIIPRAGQAAAIVAGAPPVAVPPNASAARDDRDDSDDSDDSDDRDDDGRDAADDDSDEEWEWRVAAARAKARNDDTAIIPRAGQAASLAPAPRRDSATKMARRPSADDDRGPEPLFPMPTKPRPTQPRLADGSTPGTRAPRPPRRSVAMVTPPTMRKPAPRTAGRSLASVTRPTTGRPFRDRATPGRPGTRRPIDERLARKARSLVQPPAVPASAAPPPTPSPRRAARGTASAHAICAATPTTSADGPKTER